MTPLTLSIVSLLGVLVVGEIALWRLFRRRVDPVTFPHERDRSHLRFFRIGRLRFIAAFHTLLLGTLIVVSLLWLW